MTRVFPAEWHSQWGVLLAWPHPDTDWGDIMEQAEHCYADIVAAITRYENVLLLCRDANHQAHIATVLAQRSLDNARILFVQLAYDDTWARDFAFITVLENGKARTLDFAFNAWGGKFSCARDDAVNRALRDQGVLDAGAFAARSMILEGGSLESDGAGTLLTTAQCLLNPNRNPHMSKGQIEAELRAALGVERILWLSRGHLEGDDTDAHIDTLARFVDVHTIVYMACNDPGDSHYRELQAMAAELKALRQPDGTPYQLVPIELPQPMFAQGRRLGASYVNFLMINEALLLPVYGDAQADANAIACLTRACPGRAIIPVDCRALIRQNGSLHCITMQIPQEVFANES